MLFERTSTESLNSPKFLHALQLFSETDFCKKLSLMKDRIRTMEIEIEATTNSENFELVKRKTN